MEVEYPEEKKDFPDKINFGIIQDKQVEVIDHNLVE